MFKHKRCYIVIGLKPSKEAIKIGRNKEVFTVL
jgi:hypothetical protein